MSTRDAPSPHLGVRLVARAGAAVACVAAAVAAVGWLYVLRATGPLDVGPMVTGALPLQRLAQQDAQPLLRVLLAWAPAGVLAGLALVATTRLPPPGRALIAGLSAFVVLFAAGAVSDAVTASDPIGLHIAPQLGHGALWLGAAIMAACAALVPPGARRRRAP